MASAVRADEAKLSQVQTALSNTTLSGYVDVGANYTLGNQSTYVSNNGKVADGFSLHDVVISLDKPLDESPWASGYHIDLNTGIDAVYANENLIRQAYVTLRTPLGNGIDWKIGAMDGITGYEGNTSYLNPNISRSYGYALNPATIVGLVGTYKVNDVISVTGGILNPTYNTDNVSSKSYLGSVTITAPNSWGFLKGSTWNFQTIQAFSGFNGSTYANGQNNYSVNGTFNTPIASVKLGLAYDYVQVLGNGHSSDEAAYGVYVTYQTTDKLSLALRGEYLDARGEVPVSFGYDQDSGGSGLDVTATVQYNLWANVVSRAEVRWDHFDHQNTAEFSATRHDSNAISLDLSIVYKF